MGRILDFGFWSWGGDLEVESGGEELVLFEGVDGEGYRDWETVNTVELVNTCPLKFWLPV